MREYGSIHTCFWTDPAIQQLSDQAKLLALYLLSGPHTNMMGCFRLPAGYVAEDLKWSIETVTKRFTELLKMGFIARDEPSGWLLIPNFLKWNAIENPNQGRSIIRLFEQVPHNSPIFPQLVAILLQQDKHLEEGFKNRLQTLEQQFQNQDQEQEQDQKQDQEQKSNVAPTRKNLPLDNEPIQRVFDHWREVLNHPQARLDEKRRKIIRSALKAGYSVDDLCRAIDGCSQTPHNMGANEQGQRYDGLHVILRDSDQIDRFIGNAKHPPQPSTKAQKHTQNNLCQLNNWLNKKQTNNVKEDLQL